MGCLLMPLTYTSPSLNYPLSLHDALPISFPRVGFCYSRAVDRSRAWKFAILGRWTVLARRNPRFLSGGALPRVGFCIFWGLDCYHAWKFAIPERWTLPARRNPPFLSGGPLPHVEFCDF